MRNVVRAALLYFALVFGAGFVLGTLRVLVSAPRLGELRAVLLELPVMLVVSGWACGFVLRRVPVHNARADRLAMGVLAFALVIAAEVMLSVWGFGRTPGATVAQYRAAPAQIGLAAQLLFAVMPLIRR